MFWSGIYAGFCHSLNKAQNSYSCQNCEGIFKQHNNKETSLSSEASCEPDPACVKLRRLLEVENVLVNEYAGDMRTKINAMAG